MSIETIDIIAQIPNDGGYINQTYSVTHDGDNIIRTQPPADAFALEYITSLLQKDADRHNGKYGDGSHRMTSKKSRPNRNGGRR